MLKPDVLHHHVLLEDHQGHGDEIGSNTTLFFNSLG